MIAPVLPGNAWFLRELGAASHFYVTGNSTPTRYRDASNTTWSYHQSR